MGGAFAAAASALDANDRLDQGDAPGKAGLFGRLDHRAQVLVSAGRLLGDAARRGAADQDSLQLELVDDLAAAPAL